MKLTIKQNSKILNKLKTRLKQKEMVILKYDPNIEAKPEKCKTSISCK